jgi:hypothetical protein
MADTNTLNMSVSPINDSSVIHGWLLISVHMAFG